ncbi:ribonuclease H-like domain-containing protein [Tanacetum coccineum]
MPTFTQTAFSQPAVHFQQTQPTQTNQTGQQYPNNVQSQQFQQFQTATISANNAKFPYLEKEKYEIWAMKMEYWIQNADHNLWRIVQQGNSPKRLGKDAKGNTIVHPPVSLDEHVAVQRENKVRTLLLQALPEDHMPDFHHYDDARDIWMAVKARFGGNEESKKMRKTMLKQQFTEFSVTEEEGLHKGYDRFQKILSQLNQVQARPDNDDINLKFLRALPSSWSQVALALKTRGGLDSMSFDDLYNKLRSLELDVRIGHSYGVKAAAAPTHSAFIGAASSGSKLTYSDQQSIVPSVYQTSGRSDNIMEYVLHSFVAENEPDQDMIFEDFDQVDQLEMEELDLKWQMAMLSLRINRFEKKAGRKMNYNNQQPARFDRRKVRCYKCLQLGHFARECNVKTVDDKARYSAFKVTEVKTDEPKALVSVDSMVNWSDHAAKNKTGEVEKVYGMMAGLHADNGGAGISNAADEFAMMGISPKGDPSTDNDIGIVDSGCLRSMTGNKEKLDDFVQVKGGIVKFGGGDGRISGKGTIKTSKLDFENVYYVEELQHFNLFSVSQICDKKNKVLFTDTDCLVLSEEFQLPDANSVPCKSQAASVPAGSRNSSASVTAGEFDPAARRNRSAVNSVGRPNPTGRVGRRSILRFSAGDCLKDKTPVSAGRPVLLFWHNPAARPYFRPSSVYFNNWPGLYDPMYMNEGRWGTAVKSSAGSRVISSSDIDLGQGRHCQIWRWDGRISGKGTIRTSKLDFENVYYVEELQHFNLWILRIPRDVILYSSASRTTARTKMLLDLVAKHPWMNPRWPQKDGHVNFKDNQQVSLGGLYYNPINKTPFEIDVWEADEGYLVGYAPNSKAYRVYNLTNKRVEETMNLRFLEDKPNVQGIGHEWYFDLDYLTDSLGYTRFKTDKPAGTQETNINAGTQDHDSDSEVDEQVIVVPSFPSNSFAGPSSSNGPSVMERNADYAEELAKASNDKKYDAYTQLLECYESGWSGHPCCQGTSVSADFIPVHADESTRLLVKPLGQVKTLHDFQSLLMCARINSHLASSHLPFMMMILVPLLQI